MLFALALSSLSVSRVAEIQVAVDWDAPSTRVASTAATVEVDVMPFLGRTREGGPFDAYAAALQNLGAEFVRFSPWFPYPRVVVPELRPPDCTQTKPATNWNSTLFDQIVSDFMLAVCGPGASLNFSCSHSVAQQLSTMPSWMYKGAWPLPDGTVPQDPWQYKGFSAYSVGIELVDESCEPMAAYVARVVAHYTRGGHSDTCGHWHPSGFFYKWSVLSVLNENEHSIGQERYTRCFDAIRAAVEKVNTDIVLAGPETVMWTGGFGYSPYFLEPKNHKDGRPPAINSNHVAFTEGGGATGEGYFPALDAFVNTTLVPLVALRDKLAPQTELVLDEFIPFNNDWCDPDGAAALFARHGDSLRRDPRSRASPRSRGCPNWQAWYPRCTRAVCARRVRSGCTVGARCVRSVCVCTVGRGVCAVWCMRRMLYRQDPRTTNLTISRGTLGWSSAAACFAYGFGKMAQLGYKIVGADQLIGGPCCSRGTRPAWPMARLTLSGPRPHEPPVLHAALSATHRPGGETCAASLASCGAGVSAITEENADFGVQVARQRACRHESRLDDWTAQRKVLDCADARACARRRQEVAPRRRRDCCRATTAAAHGHAGQRHLRPDQLRRRLQRRSGRRMGRAHGGWCECRRPPRRPRPSQAPCPPCWAAPPPPGLSLGSAWAATSSKARTPCPAQKAYFTCAGRFHPSGKEGILNLTACVARASGCKKANFVSFSLHGWNSDCSWYETCDFGHLCADCSQPGPHCPAPPGCPSYVPYTSEVISAVPAPRAAAPLFALPYIKHTDGARGVLLVSKTSVPTNVTLHGDGLAGASATVLDGSLDGVHVDAEPGFVAPVERIVGPDGFLALGPYAVALVSAGSELVELVEATGRPARVAPF